MDITSLHVLLVEDSPTDAQLFQHIFYRAATGQWTLVHAERLCDAIAAAQTQVFNLALLDLHLPDSGGLETILEFTQAVPLLPVIVLTISDDADLALQAVAQGAQDFLVKDQVTVQMLRRSIHYAIERSQIVQQLKASEQATLEALNKERELNQLKSYFISMVSHEFRNPLSRLRILSDLLLQPSEGLTTDKKQIYAQQMNAAINHMCQLLDEVILLGKVDTGHFELDLTTVDLEQWYYEFIEIFRVGCLEGRNIIFTCPPNLGPVAIDVNLLGHILTNLLTNAIKYSAPDSDIHLQVRKPNGQLILTVRDRGIGIPEKEYHRLFEAFSRCSNVGAIQGTGLGLAIVKRCIDLWGGDIQIDSQVGVGTTVTIQLPLWD